MLTLSGIRFSLLFCHQSACEIKSLAKGGSRSAPATKTQNPETVRVITKDLIRDLRQVLHWSGTPYSCPPIYGVWIITEICLILFN